MKKRNNYRNRDLRPQSLCDNDLVFMRSATDINFASKGKKLVMERRSSCTEINSQPEQVPLRETASKEDVSKEKNFWDKVGAKKLLSRKKSAKARPHSVALSDLQTVSTDKILELYAQESHAAVSGSSSKINSLIWEDNELNPSMGLRTMSTIDLKSQGYSREHFSSVHASFRERRSSFQPMADFRMSERFTPSTSKTKDFNLPGSTAEKKIRPVAKPRQRLKTVSNETISSCQQNKESVTANSVERTFKNDITDCSTKRTKNFTSYQTNRSVYGDKRLEDVEEFDARSVETDHSLECTDVSDLLTCLFLFSAFNIVPGAIRTVPYITRTWSCTGFKLGWVPVVLVENITYSKCIIFNCC